MQPRAGDIAPTTRARRCHRLVALAFVGLAVGGREPLLAASLSVNAELTGKDGSDSATRALDQRYDLNLSHQAALTSLMRLAGAMRYSRTVADGDTRQVVAPSLDATLDNSLFAASLQGTADKTITEGEPARETYTWEASFRSKPAAPFLLNGLHLFAGQTWAKDSGTPAGEDSRASHAGGNATWRLPAGDLRLGLRAAHTTDRIAKRTGRNRQVQASFSTQRTLFSRRLTLSLNQQFSRTTTEHTAPADRFGLALLPVAIGAVEAGTPPADPTATLPAVPALHDGDLQTTAFSIPALPATSAIVLRTDYRRVDTIHLVTVDDVSALAPGLAFALYASDNGTSWNLVTPAVPLLYDAGEQRLVVQVPNTSALFLKLLTTSTPNTEIRLAELTAWHTVVANTGTTVTEKAWTENATTDLGATARLRPDLSLHYTLSFQKTRADTLPTYQRLLLNSGLNWNARQGLDVDLRSTALLQHHDGKAENLVRTYGGTFQWQPTTTLRLVAGLVFRETFLGSQRQSRTTTYHASATADIYRDLGSRLDYTRTEGKDETTGNRSTSDTVTAYFTARLFPSLVADLNLDHRRTRGATPSSSARLALAWRPSPILSLRSSLSGDWAETDSSTATLGVDLAMTRKTRLSATWQGTLRPSFEESARATWYWTINDHLRLSCEGGIQDGPTSSWDVVVRLRANRQLP